MGMDQQSGALLEKGLDMAQGFLEKDSRDEARDDATRLAEARAGLAEQEAAGDASLRQRQAKRDASAFREQAEQDRAEAHAAWGASNLAMSGSKALVRDSGRLKDRQAEEDLLFQGDLEAQRALNQGRGAANLMRINGGAATRSTLALGSKLYQYGG
ncbi:MAG: hypothetical protein V3571_08095 [Pseudodesulfovibrio sp.]